jgi:hypothetical protein
VLLIAVSTTLRALASRGIPTPWIGADELLYGQLGRSLYHSGSFQILGQPAAYYSLVYPAFAGLPLSVGSFGFGYALLKVVQALVMSLTAVPVYLWARSLARPWWAVAAAALTLAVPGLAYSGLIMTEVAFYPALLLAAWALARALARPTLGNQALAVGGILLCTATRLQALVLVPVLVSALLVMLAFDRSLARARRLWPTFACLGVAAAAYVAWRLHSGGLLAAYSAAGQGHYSLAEVWRFVLYHAADVLLLVGFFPVCAVALLVPVAVRERSDELRAYVAVVVALAGWLVLEVGAFASRHVGHIAERDLLALAPVAFVGFAVWLSRGSPRPRRATALVALGAFVLLVKLPIPGVLSPSAYPDSFTLIPLTQLVPHVPHMAFVLDLAAAVLLALFATVPRRFAWLLPVALVGALGVASASASNVIRGEATGMQARTLGAENSWVDRYASGGVAYVYTDDVWWNSVWQTTFWNRSVDRVYTVASGPVTGPIPQLAVTIAPDGLVVGANGPSYAVASRAVTFAGAPVARSTAGLVLWRVDRPLRISTYTRGLRYDGVISHRARVQGWGCAGKSLRVVLTTAAARRIVVRRGDSVYDRMRLRAGEVLHAEVPAGRDCRFELDVSGPVSVRALDVS